MTNSNNPSYIGKMGNNAIQYIRNIASAVGLSLLGACAPTLQTRTPDAILPYELNTPKAEEKSTASPTAHEDALRRLLLQARGGVPLSKQDENLLDLSDGAYRETIPTIKDQNTADYLRGRTLPQYLTVIGERQNPLDSIDKLTLGEAKGVWSRESNSYSGGAGILVNGKHRETQYGTGQVHEAILKGQKKELEEILKGASYNNIDVWHLVQNGKQIGKVRYYSFTKHGILPVDEENFGYERSARLYTPEEFKKVLKELGVRPSHLEKGFNIVKPEDVFIVGGVGAITREPVAPILTGLSILYFNFRNGNDNVFYQRIVLKDPKPVDNTVLERWLNPELGDIRFIQPIKYGKEAIGTFVYDFTAPKDKVQLSEPKVVVSEPNERFFLFLQKLGASGLAISNYFGGRASKEAVERTKEVPVPAGHPRTGGNVFRTR
jgi:hypothetical protein